MGSGGFIISSEIAFQLLSGSRPCAACERFFRPKRHDAHVFVILERAPQFCLHRGPSLRFSATAPYKSRHSAYHSFPKGTFWPFILLARVGVRV